MVLYLAPFTAEDEVRPDVVIPERVPDVEAKRTIMIVDISFRFIAQNRIRSVDLLELRRRKRAVFSASPGHELSTTLIS